MVLRIKLTLGDEHVNQMNTFSMHTQWHVKKPHKVADTVIRVFCKI